MRDCKLFCNAHSESFSTEIECLNLRRGDVRTVRYKGRLLRSRCRLFTPHTQGLLSVQELRSMGSRMQWKAFLLPCRCCLDRNRSSWDWVARPTSNFPVWRLCALYRVGLGSWWQKSTAGKAYTPQLPLVCSLRWCSWRVHHCSNAPLSWKGAWVSLWFHKARLYEDDARFLRYGFRDSHALRRWRL